MKKLALILLAGLIMASFAGCLKDSSSSSSVASAPESVAESVAESAATETPADAVTTASPKEMADPYELVKGLSADGYWIVAALSDITVDEEILVEGEFHDKGDSSNDIYRKLALYSQDAEYKVTAEYTLTAPKMTVSSQNFRIQNGTFKGDVYVTAEGFELAKATIDGNLTFATEEAMASALLEDGTVTGEISVG